VGKIAEKAACRLSAELTKNALLQTVFWAILPNGLSLSLLFPPLALEEDFGKFLTYI